jgi:hypothetical protein
MPSLRPHDRPSRRHPLIEPQQHLFPVLHLHPEQRPALASQQPPLLLPQQPSRRPLEQDSFQPRYLGLEQPPLLPAFLTSLQLLRQPSFLLLLIRPLPPFCIAPCMLSTIFCPPALRPRRFLDNNAACAILGSWQPPVLP